MSKKASYLSIRGHLASLELTERYVKSVLWICIDFSADSGPEVCCKILKIKKNDGKFIF